MSRIRACGLLIVVGIAIIFCGVLESGFPYKKIRFYSNMVNATVFLDYGDGYGTGVFIDDNVVLTAAHCLEDADTFTVELVDGTILESSDFYIDEEVDIGFVFVDANELHIATVSDAPQSLGDVIHLVGTPYDNEFKFSLFRGIISHLDRDLPKWKWENLLQVDADGGPGMSGGPLYNVEGHLIGMCVGTAYRGGFSISLCENAKHILDAYERAKENRLLREERKSPHVFYRNQFRIELF